MVCQPAHARAGELRRHTKTWRTKKGHTMCGLERYSSRDGPPWVHREDARHRQANSRVDVLRQKPFAEIETDRKVISQPIPRVHVALGNNMRSPCDPCLVVGLRSAAGLEAIDQGFIARTNRLLDPFSTHACRSHRSKSMPISRSRSRRCRQLLMNHGSQVFSAHQLYRCARSHGFVRSTRQVGRSQYLRRLSYRN